MDGTFTVMVKNDPQLEVKISGTKITCKQLAEKLWWGTPVYIRPENITLGNFTRFVESRVPSKYRPDMTRLLKKYDVPFWDPYLMVLRSHGISVTDDVWVKFNNEDTSYESISVR